jgi:hypothetical protein
MGLRAKSLHDLYGKAFKTTTRPMRRRPRAVSKAMDLKKEKNFFETGGIRIPERGRPRLGLNRRG